MRVISGRAKGRKLQPVPGSTTRPIMDRVKTALFDVLRPELEDAHVLDLFAGTGSIGIEALSQGAAHCVFIEIERRAAETIRKNLAHTELAEFATVRHGDAFGFLKKCSRNFDLIFIDPPQYQSLWSEALRAIAERPELLRDNGLIIVKIDPHEYEELTLNDFTEEKRRRYGSSELVFYRKTTGCL
ncbi:MAG: 16S rRNA (guanine(966)-N(2))-methyltransferase RsmD [Candidatus Dadabacteria bacterium]|nr:MAG: 16S rRNA (guanine(966)-N(2))-methyltransferase RsmD [Candidatus Dadabacteria bacterium]